MITYKITRKPEDKPEKYYTDLMAAMDKKQYLKRLLNCKDEDFHIFGKYPGKKEWFKLE